MRKTNTFILSERSKDLLEPLHPDIYKVVLTAIDITEVDFSVFEGMRSVSRQKELVNIGASRTMNSRHLTGHAVDLVAYVGGSLRWDWPLYYKIAYAMRQSCIHHGVDMTWGGVWDRSILDLSDDIEREVYLYTRRQRDKGKSAFIDGPHFQLSWNKYPKQV